MGRSGSRRVARLLVAGIAVAASLLRPAGGEPGRGRARDDGLALTSATTYTLVPDKSLVHVVDRADRARTRSRTSSARRRAARSRPATSSSRRRSASSPRRPRSAASAGKQHLATHDSRRDDGFSRPTVDVPGRPLLRPDARRSRSTFDLPGGAPRSESDDPGRVGVRDVLRLGVRRRRRRPGSSSPAASTSRRPARRPRSRSTAGVSTVSATGIDDATDWYAIVVADRKDALTSDRLDLPGGEHLVDPRLARGHRVADPRHRAAPDRACRSSSTSSASTGR